MEYLKIPTVEDIKNIHEDETILLRLRGINTFLELHKFYRAKKYFNELFGKFVNYALTLPGAKKIHHTQDKEKYGLIVHTLDVVFLTLERIFSVKDITEIFPHLDRIGQNYFIEEKKQDELERIVSATITGALLHDIGKIFHIKCQSRSSEEIWDPKKETLKDFLEKEHFNVNITFKENLEDSAIHQVWGSYFFITLTSDEHRNFISNYLWNLFDYLSGNNTSSKKSNVVATLIGDSDHKSATADQYKNIINNTPQHTKKPPQIKSDFGQEFANELQAFLNSSDALLAFNKNKIIISEDGEKVAIYTEVFNTFLDQYFPEKNRRSIKSELKKQAIIVAYSENRMTLSVAININGKLSHLKGNYYIIRKIKELKISLPENVKRYKIENPNKIKSKKSRN